MDNGTRSVSKWIVGTILIVILALVSVLIGAVATGAVDTDVDISTEINVVGTIPIDIIAYGVMGFVGWMVYVAFMDIYDSDEVKQSVEDASQMADDLNN